MERHTFQFLPLWLRRTMRLLPAALCCVVFTAVTQAEDFIVPGTSGTHWVDTGVDIEPDSVLQLSAIGEVDAGSGWGVHRPDGSRPDGMPPARCAPPAGFPFPVTPSTSVQCYGLVASLVPPRAPGWPGFPEAETSERWGYADEVQHHTALGGHLWLTVNDNYTGDNSGFFKVHLEHFIFTWQIYCHPCPLDEVTQASITGLPLPDPKIVQALMVRDGQIISVHQSGGTTFVSVSPGTVLVKYGDLPSLKVDVAKDTARPDQSLSKQGVIQGVFFQNNKMSLITGAAQLKLDSKAPDKTGEKTNRPDVPETKPGAKQTKPDNK